jgi:radical SAM superfamily enzyme YgiQ (UPF0313 family)
LISDDTIVIRPPSEANSFLLPVTIGCSHNACAFCSTFYDFKFGVRTIEEIEHDIDAVAARYGRNVSRVFLENGDALIAPQEILAATLKYLKLKFPNLERVGTYSTPKAALLKTPVELRKLHELGLTIAYLGVETGDEALLKKINKGATRAQIVEAGRKLKQAGITTSVTVILGLAGQEGSEQHAVATGKILTEIDPDFAGALTLMFMEGTALHKDYLAGRFKLISPFQSLVELKLIIENSSFTDCFFTANHASNYLPIKARLPQQKAELLALIENVLAKKDLSMLRPEYIRAL